MYKIQEVKSDLVSLDMLGDEGKKGVRGSNIWEKGGYPNFFGKTLSSL